MLSVANQASEWGDSLRAGSRPCNGGRWRWCCVNWHRHALRLGRLVAALVVTAGAAGVVVDIAVVVDRAEGELGDGLKLSKVELPVLAGSVSFVAAGSGALGTVVDLRPRL